MNDWCTLSYKKKHKNKVSIYLSFHTAAPSHEYYVQVNFRKTKICVTAHADQAYKSLWAQIYFDNCSCDRCNQNSFNEYQIKLSGFNRSLHRFTFLWKMTGKTTNWNVRNTMLKARSNFKTFDFFMARFHVDYSLSSAPELQTIWRQRFTLDGRGHLHCSAENRNFQNFL